MFLVLFDAELCELLLYFGYHYFTKYVVCQYFLPVCRLALLVAGFLGCAEPFSLTSHWLAFALMG